MANRKFDTQIPTFGTYAEVRQVLQAEADRRTLKLPDVVREALNEYIGSHNLVEALKAEQAVTITQPLAGQ